MLHALEQILLVMLRFCSLEQEASVAGGIEQKVTDVHASCLLTLV